MFFSLRTVVSTTTLLLLVLAVAPPVSAGEPDVTPASAVKSQATPADRPDPMSERAAAAAARAARALAEENEADPEDVTPAAIPTPAPAGAPGKAVTPADKRRTSAEVTCLAGC